MRCSRPTSSAPCTCTCTCAATGPQHGSAGQGKALFRSYRGGCPVPGTPYLPIFHLLCICAASVLENCNCTNQSLRQRGASSSLVADLLLSARLRLQASLGASPSLRSLNSFIFCQGPAATAVDTILRRTQGASMPKWCWAG